MGATKQPSHQPIDAKLALCLETLQRDSSHLLELRYELLGRPQEGPFPVEQYDQYADTLLQLAHTFAYARLVVAEVRLNNRRELLKGRLIEVDGSSHTFIDALAEVATSGMEIVNELTETLQRIGFIQPSPTSPPEPSPTLPPEMVGTRAPTQMSIEFRDNPPTR